MLAIRAQVSEPAIRPLPDGRERSEMRRIFVGGAVLALLGAAAGCAMGRWGVANYLRIRSEAWKNPVQLVALEQLHSNEPERAIRLLESGIEGQAIYLSHWLELDEGGLATEPRTTASCQLQEIQEYRRDHPSTSMDSGYSTILADALAYPTHCETPEARRATMPSRELDSSSGSGDAVDPQQQAVLSE